MAKLRIIIFSWALVRLWVYRRRSFYRIFNALNTYKTWSHNIKTTQATHCVCWFDLWFHFIDRSCTLTMPLCSAFICASLADFGMFFRNSSLRSSASETRAWQSQSSKQLANTGTHSLKILIYQISCNRSNKAFIDIRFCHGRAMPLFVVC